MLLIEACTDSTEIPIQSISMVPRPYTPDESVEVHRLPHGRRGHAFAQCLGISIDAS
jgi:hypothetical protein